MCVAVSGGPDSLALTALTRALYYEKKFKIYYVLVDHNLRAGSSKEAESVKKLLKKNKISLHVIKNKKKLKIMFKAKLEKFDMTFFSAFCRKKGIRTILTAHNLEDQVETFFIRLSRGSGLHGLSSMKETNKLDKITLLRPLLEIRKNDLIKITKTAFR